MEQIVFVTHNKGKIASANNKLEGLIFKIFEYVLDELSIDDLVFVTHAKGHINSVIKQ